MNTGVLEQQGLLHIPPALRLQRPSYLLLPCTLLLRPVSSLGDHAFHGGLPLLKSISFPLSSSHVRLMDNSPSEQASAVCQGCELQCHRERIVFQLHSVSFVPQGHHSWPHICSFNLSVLIIELNSILWEYCNYDESPSGNTVPAQNQVLAS